LDELAKSGIILNRHYGNLSAREFTTLAIHSHASYSLQILQSHEV
jgi:hypothetical protein